MITEEEARFADELRRIDDPSTSAVAEWRVRLGNDWTDDPATYVDIVFDDSRIYDVWHERLSLRLKVEELARERFPERFPYVSFASQSDWINPEKPVGLPR